MTTENKLDNLVSEITEKYRCEPIAKYRSFIKSCGLLLLDNLPNIAVSWMNASDDYANKIITPEELEKIRVSAWEYHDQQRKSLSKSEVAGLRVIMYGLWPSVEGNTEWSEAFEYFIEYCQEAGIANEEIFRRLVESFSG